MMTTTLDETAAFGAAVAAAAEEQWGAPADAAAGDLASMWRIGAALGWFELGAADAVAAAIAATRELGRLACPLPVVDGFVAARLLAGDPERQQAVADGRIRVLVATTVDGDAPALGAL